MAIEQLVFGIIAGLWIIRIHPSIAKALHRYYASMRLKNRPDLRMGTAISSAIVCTGLWTFSSAIFAEVVYDKITVGQLKDQILGWGLLLGGFCWVRILSRR